MLVIYICSYFVTHQRYSYSTKVVKTFVNKVTTCNLVTYKGNAFNGFQYLGNSLLFIDKTKKCHDKIYLIN